MGKKPGLRLPKHILETASISVGDEVEVLPDEGRIVIKKVARRKLDLAEMVSRMPADYEVREETFGRPVGKEAW